MKHPFFKATIAVAILSIYLHPTFAQLGTVTATSGPSVSGSGAAVVEHQPELLRMQVDVLAKGKDLKEALGKLKQRRKSAEEQLGKLGADAKSIQFGPPRITPAENDQQRQMQIMMRQRMMQRRGPRRASEKPTVAPPVTVSMSLTAEWPLKGDEAESLLVAGHDLEEKIKAADLAGKKAAEELSAEEEEAAEESEDEETQMYYGGQQQPKPGEPQFAYVYRVTDKERAKAFTEAFERAKADAERLAKAASAKLGELQQLSGGNETGVAADDYNDQWTSYRYQMFQRSQRAASDEKLEAVGPQPGMLKYQVTVTASFALK